MIVPCLVIFVSGPSFFPACENSQFSTLGPLGLRSNIEPSNHNEAKKREQHSHRRLLNWRATNHTQRVGGNGWLSLGFGSEIGTTVLLWKVSIGACCAKNCDIAKSKRRRTRLRPRSHTARFPSSLSLARASSPFVIARSFHSSVSIARASNHHHVPYALGRLNRLALDGACFLALIGPSPLALIRRIRSILYARASRGKQTVSRALHSGDARHA